MLVPVLVAVDDAEVVTVLCKVLVPDEDCVDVSVDDIDVDTVEKKVEDAVELTVEVSVVVVVPVVDTVVVAVDVGVVVVVPVVEAVVEALDVTELSAVELADDVAVALSVEEIVEVWVLVAVVAARTSIVPYFLDKVFLVSYFAAHVIASAISALGAFASTVTEIDTVPLYIQTVPA